MKATCFTSRTVGFTMVEILAVIAAVAVISSIGYVTVSNTQQAAAATKLQQDVESINRAIQIFVSNGGNLTGVTGDYNEGVANNCDVLTALKMTAANNMIGTRGSVLDNRIYATNNAGGSSRLRARWQGSTDPAIPPRFVIQESSTGITEFPMDDALSSSARTSTNRSTTKELDTSGGWVWNNSIPAEEVTASGDSPTLNSISGAAGAGQAQGFAGGAWTVGPTGRVTTTYVYDGAGYEGQLGFFSLRDMGPDNYDLTTPAGLLAFYKEAVRRIIENQTTGRMVLDARANDSSTVTTYTYQFDVGDTIAAILIPSATFAQALTELSKSDPDETSTRYPLTSLSFASDDHGGFNRSQAISLGRDAYAFEDIPGGGDRDYEDLIWKAEGLDQPDWSTMNSVDPNTYYVAKPYWNSPNTNPSYTRESIKDTLTAAGIIP